MIPFRGTLQGLLHARASWVAGLIGAYLLLGANVDFAAHLTWHDGQRLAQLGLMGLGLLFVFSQPELRGEVGTLWLSVPQPGRYAMYMALVIGMASAVSASLPRWALLEWGLIALLVFFTLAVAAGRRAGGVNLDRLLIGLLTLVAAAYSAKTVVIYGAMLTVGAGYGMNFNVHDLFTGFSNIRFFGHVQTMILPLLLLPAMCWAKSMRQRILLSVVPIIWWMLVAASGTRGTWLGLAAGALVVLAFGRAVGRRWLRWQTLGIAGGLIGYALFMLWVPKLVDQPAVFLHRSSDLTSLSMRDVIWIAAMEFTRMHPLLGIGPMHFAQHTNTVAAHPHNTLLQLMSEWGVPAALVFTAILAAGGITFAFRVRTLTASGEVEKSSTAVALLAAMTGAAAQAMVDGVLVMPMSQMTLVLICGWAAGLYFECSPLRLVKATSEKAICAVFVLLAAGSVIHGVYPEIGQLEAREAAFLKSQPQGTILLPRFWAQGWIGE